MDDEQYRQARDSLAEPLCVYGKALQAGHFNCQHAKSIQLGEREAMHCSAPQAYGRCETYYSLCTRHSGFALGRTELPQHLSFNQAMKVQIGGLKGAVNMLNIPQTGAPFKEPIEAHSISDLLSKLARLYDGFEALDFSQIVPQISAFTFRKSRRPREN